VQHVQAFKNYDEAGAVRRIQCLKYLVLATMLNQSDVDPFDAQVCTLPSFHLVSHVGVLQHVAQHVPAVTGRKLSHTGVTRMWWQ
jgi:hypothetical protein